MNEDDRFNDAAPAQSVPNTERTGSRGSAGYLGTLAAVWAYLAFQCALIIYLLGIKQGGARGLVLFTLFLAAGAAAILAYDYLWIKLRTGDDPATSRSAD